MERSLLAFPHYNLHRHGTHKFRLEFDSTGCPILAIGAEEAKKGRCTECLACELECEFHGNQGIIVDLPIPGLEDAVGKGD